jgi:hypothetical protein
MEQFIGCDAHKKFSVFVAVKMGSNAVPSHPVKNRLGLILHNMGIYRQESTWGFIARNPHGDLSPGIHRSMFRLRLLVPYLGPDQRKFSTSTKLLPAWSICVYKIQRPSGEIEIAVLLELSRLVPRENS